MTRLFVAVRPPPHVRAVLDALPRTEQPGVRWVPPQQWHVTLRFLGTVDPHRGAAEVVAALEGLDLPAVVAVLGPRVSRLGRDVVVVPVAGLDPLASAVRAATAGIGAPPDPRGFTGHLTLARLRHRAACGVAGAAVSASFAVERIELVASKVDHRGAVHEVLAEFLVADPGNA